MPSGTDRAQVERVEGLLASVQDAVATLQKLGSQLEREVARALYQDNPDGGATLATLELENTRLRTAVEGRALIEQAKGVIIAKQGGSEQDAFAVLTQIARREQVSVRDAAGAIIEAGARAHLTIPEPAGAGPDAASGSPAGTTAPPVIVAGASRAQVLGPPEPITAIEPIAGSELAVPHVPPVPVPRVSGPAASAPAAELSAEAADEPAAEPAADPGAEPAAGPDGDVGRAASGGDVARAASGGEAGSTAAAPIAESAASPVAEAAPGLADDPGATMPLQLSELITRDDVLDPDGSDPGRRRWRLSSPSHASKRSGPRFRSSAF